MQQAPLPTEDQIERVRDAMGASSLVHSHRLDGGVGCTMDVLMEASTRLVLRRYGPSYARRGENAAERETRALELLQRSNIPAPAPIWIDTDGVFDEQAIVTSFVPGAPDLSPADPFAWAEKLAATLARIHDVRLNEDDVETFPPGAGEDERRILENPEQVLAHPLGEKLLRMRLMLDDRRTEAGSVFSHTDFWPGNTMWDNGDLTAVIDWESPATGDRAMDVAYCALDIRYLGMDKVAERFVSAYRQVTEDDLVNLRYWEAVALCRPMPDIATWVPAWRAMGRSINEEQARERHSELIEEFLNQV